MRNVILAAATLAACASETAEAHHQQLMLQLNGPIHSRFAGYYVADYQGFYDEAELGVTIIPGGPGESAAKALVDGSANVIVERMPAALASREKGVPLVNIAQPFKGSSMQLTCRTDSGIEPSAGLLGEKLRAWFPESQSRLRHWLAKVGIDLAPWPDLRGRTVGVWAATDQYPFRAWMARLGLETSGAAAGVTLVEQGPSVDLLLQRKADCISTRSYDEYWQLIDAGLEPKDLIVVPYDGQGVATLEDGLWVLEGSLQSPDNVLDLGRFVHATARGWAWARENPVEAVRVMQEYDPTGTLEEAPQVRMLKEIIKLTEGSTGALDPTDYERTVATLLASGPDSVITKPPVGAWTPVVSDAAELGQR